MKVTTANHLIAILAAQALVKDAVEKTPANDVTFFSGSFRRDAEGRVTVVFQSTKEIA